MTTSSAAPFSHSSSSDSHPSQQQTYRILFQCNSHKRTCTLSQKPTSLSQIHNYFLELFPKWSANNPTSAEYLKENLQFYDSEFEEWIDLISLDEIPDRKLKVRLNPAKQKSRPKTPTHTQSNYSFQKTFSFKSHVPKNGTGGSSKTTKRKTNGSSSNTENRPKSASRTRRHLGNFNDRPMSAGASRKSASSTPREDSTTEKKMLHRRKRAASSMAGGRYFADQDTSEDDWEGIHDGTSTITSGLSSRLPSKQKVSAKKRNYTVPYTPKVLQRSLQYREKHEQKRAQKKKASQKKRRAPKRSESKKASHLSSSMPLHSSLTSSLNLPLGQHDLASSLSASGHFPFTNSLNSPSNLSSRQHDNVLHSPASNQHHTISFTALDPKTKKQQQIEHALEGLRVYNPSLLERFYSLHVFEPNVPVPIYKIVDILWNTDTQTSIQIAKQLEARNLLKYEDHHIILQSHHHTFLQNSRGDPFHLHKLFLQALAQYCRASSVRFRRPSVEQLESQDKISIDEVDWCSFNDGTTSLASKRYFFKQLTYHLVGCKKFHLLHQLLLRPAFLISKISLWSEKPEVILRDFQLLEEYGMSSKAHTQIKEALIMSLDYLKNNDHELVAQLIGRLSVSKLPEVQSFLSTCASIVDAKDYSWLRPLHSDFSGLYTCNSGIKLISAPGGCVQTDYRQYIFNAHGRIAYQRNIQTGLVEQHFPVLDEAPQSEIVALAVTPNGEKLVASIVSSRMRELSSAMGSDRQKASSSSSVVSCSLRVWSVKTGAHLRYIEAEPDTHLGNVMVATKDNRYVITSNKNPIKVRNLHHHVSQEKAANQRSKEMYYAIQVYDIHKGQLLKFFKGHISPIVDLCVSSSGQYLVSGSRQSIRVWDCTNLNTALRKQIMKFTVNADPKVKVKQAPLSGHFCMDPLEKYIFAATSDGVLQIHLLSGNYVQTLATGVGPISTLSFDPFHKTLVLGLVKLCRVEVWDIEEDDIVREYKDFYCPAERILVHDDHYIVDCGVDYRYFVSNREHTSSDVITCVSDVVIVPSVESTHQGDGSLETKAVVRDVPTSDLIQEEDLEEENQKPANESQNPSRDEKSPSSYKVLVKSQPNPEGKQGIILSFDLLTGKRDNSFSYVEGDNYLSANASTAAIRSKEESEYSIKVLDLQNEGQVLQNVVLQEPCFDVTVSKNGERVYYIAPNRQHVCSLHVESNRITETNLKLQIAHIFLCANDRFLALVPLSTDCRPLMLLDTQSNKLVTNRHSLPYVTNQPNYFSSKDGNWIWIHHGRQMEIYDVIHDCIIYCFDSSVKNICRLTEQDNAQFATFSSFCYTDGYLLAASFEENKLFVYYTAKCRGKLPINSMEGLRSTVEPVHRDDQGEFRSVHLLRCQLMATYSVDGHILSVDAIRLGDRLIAVCGIESSERSLCFVELKIKKDQVLKICEEEEDFRIGSESSPNGQHTQEHLVLSNGAFPDISHINSRADEDEEFDELSFMKEIKEATMREEEDEF